MRSSRFLASCVVCLCLIATAASAQDSSWGVASSFAPWQTPSSLEKFTDLVFVQDRPDPLQGSDVKLGVVRGRVLSGDWGVSFVRKQIEDTNRTILDGTGCTGSQAGSTAPLIYRCTQNATSARAEGLQLTGVEFHKFAPVVTIKRRVQLGVNMAAGVAVGKGSYRTQSSTTTFSCSFAPGASPQGVEDPCLGGTRGAEVVASSDATLHPFGYIVRYEQNLVPLARLELAGTLIASSQLKVRFGGGLNYPGLTTLGVTGIVFFR